jgi:hypothetical protein
MRSCAKNTSTLCLPWLRGKIALERQPAIVIHTKAGTGASDTLAMFGALTLRPIAVPLVDFSGQHHR